MTILSKKCVQYGQVLPYDDSVYIFEVETTPGTDTEAWEVCQSLRGASHRKDGVTHDGRCGFPFGLDTFGSLKQLDETGTKWRYTVTSPYCD